MAREPGHGGRRGRLARLRTQVHLSGDRVGAGGPAYRRTDRSRPRRVREDGLGRTGAGPLLVDGGSAPRDRRRRPRPHSGRAVRPTDRPQLEHRTPRLGEDLRPASRRLQPRARLEPPGRPEARESAAAGPRGLHRGVEAQGRARTRGGPAHPDPRLPRAARRARRGQEPSRRGLRAGGRWPRRDPSGEGLRHRPRSRHRKAVAA